MRIHGFPMTRINPIASEDVRARAQAMLEADVEDARSTGRETLPVRHESVRMLSTLLLQLERQDAWRTGRNIREITK